MKRLLVVLLAIQAGILSTDALGREVRKMEKLTVTSAAFAEGAAIAG